MRYIKHVESCLNADNVVCTNSQIFELSDEDKGDAQERRISFWEDRGLVVRCFTCKKHMRKPYGGRYEYCPHCGAYMVDVSEEEEEKKNECEC